MNQTLKQRLFEFDEEHSWDTRLPRVLHAINCSENATTKMTPFQIETGLSGRNLNDQIDLPRQITENLEELRRLAVERTTLEKELRVLKQGNETFVPFAQDDLVLTKNHQGKMPRYIGPFKITKVRGNGLTYELQKMDGTGTHIRAATELKPYYDRPEETQSSPETPSTTDMPPTSSVDFFDDEDFGINFFPVVSDSEPPDQPTPPQSATPQSATPPTQPTSPEPSPTPSEEFHSINHKRTTDGHLVFETTFDPTEKSKLKDFSSLELKVLMKAYNIPPPSVLANKNATYKHCKKFLLKKYPNADLENDDIIFNITRCKTPENPKQIALLKTRKSS